MKGWLFSHKRIYRIYRELGLNLRMRPRQRLKPDKPEPLAVPDAINQVWSIDFVNDNLVNGRAIRTFTVADDFNRDGLRVEVDFSLSPERVTRVLDQLIEWRGKPMVIRLDNGPQYISHHFKRWAKERCIELRCIHLKLGGFKMTHNRSSRC